MQSRKLIESFLKAACRTVYFTTLFREGKKHVTAMGQLKMSWLSATNRYKTHSNIKNEENRNEIHEVFLIFLLKSTHTEFNCQPAFKSIDIPVFKKYKIVA